MKQWDQELNLTFSIRYNKNLVIIAIKFDNM